MAIRPKLYNIVRMVRKNENGRWAVCLKKKKNKNSDTDSSSVTESDEKGFFSRSHRRTGGSYPVGDEFETRIIKHHENDLIEYKASPKNVIRTKQQRTFSPVVDTEDAEAIGRRLERQKVKARVEARHLRLKDDSSDSENNAPVAKTAFGGSSHIIHSRCNEQSRNAAKKTRTARTNRYLQRHGLPDAAVVNQQGQWVSNPIYQRETHYVPRAFSAVTSPVSSPVKTRYECSTMPYSKCDSLYGRVWSHPQLPTSSPTKSSSSYSVPPPPPPRNPNRRVTYAVNGGGRPLSYAFDARSPPKEIESFVNDNQGLKISQNLRELSKPDGENSLTRYCADKNPRSRNPIQLVQSDTVTENAELNRANKVGIPVVDRSSSRSPMLERKLNETTPTNNSYKYEKSRAQIKSKPKNLEEALLELEEIYNSLQLSDEELLERAERKDLQSALRSNPNFSRYSCSDLDSSVEDTVNRRLHSSVGPLSHMSRRSVVPDKKYDDMAYRKLRKKCTEDTKLTPNVVSQSGSFLLVSPALSPPPLVRVPTSTSQMTSLLSQLNREPDITLDDVVFRNLKHSNDTLRINDPQPPFGIPLGPVLSAPNSDYLHATPNDKYRSTFNPSRMPDLVKDDLAFRNLRKDAQNGPQMLPALGADETKKRRAIRSLSANMIVPSNKNGNHYSDRKDALNANYRNDQQKLNHCASFNNLPDVLDSYRSQQKELLRNCRECLSPPSNNLIADEAKLLRLKLRELEALPSSKKLQTKDIDQRPENKVFVKRVAVHKPVTLSRFTIVGDDRDPNKKIYDNSNDVENVTTSKGVVETENSSSGVSSKSETPDSGAATAASSRLNSTCAVNNLCPESCETAPSLQLLPWRENVKERRNQMKTTSAPARQRSRIEIRLSTPQEAGTIRVLSEILAEFTPNTNLLLFAIYVIAFMCQWLFTSFSIYEIFMVFIVLVAYYFTRINEH